MKYDQDEFQRYYALFDLENHAPEWPLYKSQEAVLLLQNKAASYGGLISISHFLRAFSELKASGAISQLRAPKPAVVEEIELTPEAYHKIPAREVARKYMIDEAFKAGVDNLIALGKDLMPTDNRVRIKIQYQNQPWYFVRMEDAGVRMASFDEIHEAALLSRESALVRRKALRAVGWDACVVTRSGVTLFEDVTAPSQTAKSEERVPMQCAGILLTPGCPPRCGYFVRFPGTSLESIWAPTAEEVYQKLIEHPLAKTLLPLAERYIAPPERIPSPAEVAAASQREKYGNRFIRPGDRD